MYGIGKLKKGPPEKIFGREGIEEIVRILTLFGSLLLLNRGNEGRIDMALEVTPEVEEAFRKIGRAINRDIASNLALARIRETQEHVRACQRAGLTEALRAPEKWPARTKHTPYDGATVRGPGVTKQRWYPRNAEAT